MFRNLSNLEYLLIQLPHERKCSRPILVDFFVLFIFIKKIVKNMSNRVKYLLRKVVVRELGIFDIPSRYKVLSENCELPLKSIVSPNQSNRITFSTM